MSSSTAHVIALLSAGELAVELWRAETAAADAKHRYVRKIERYEQQHGDLVGRLSPAKPEHAGAIAFSAAAYASHQAARRKVYSLRRRLRAASCKAARLAAAHA
ncbi:hypothetical protein GJ698_14955 [Pseudoduganella sp. FT26W]|uniref:Uncharacterized protein n=1 Tax=Duganella aquatilis TaxID=2666082 RepID=A0A844CY67_9BURK|nr:hypothetical protein [Duganella aquatilis]MRW85383.1 hypothetical protein [Duganella aquatilis]